MVEFDALRQDAVIDLALPVGDDGVADAAHEIGLDEIGDALEDEDRGDRRRDQVDAVESLVDDEFIGDLAQDPGAGAGHGGHHQHRQHGGAVAEPVLLEGFPDQPCDEALVFRRTEEAKQMADPMPD